ncbi:MAG: SGNH/GDSL hydrolase family protein [Puniceicoccales bacterium]
MKSLLAQSTRLLTFIAVCVAPCFANSATVSPDDAAIHYSGRFTDDYRFAWTGCSITTQFDGTTIAAKLKLVAGPNAGVTVVIDGKPHFIEITREQSEYVLADNLQPGIPHTISVYKRSEGSRGTLQFEGFEISDDGKLSPVAALPHKMLAFGDSITCGYGNEAKEISDGNTIENQNGYMSYAAITARELDAEIMMVCWSGRGMYRNRQENHDQQGVLPELFEQTLPLSAEPQWDHSKFIPEVVIINLGTNDSATLNGKKSPLDRDAFVAKYIAFIERVQEFTPDAQFFLCIGPMQAGDVPEWLPQIANQVSNATVVIFPKFANRDEIGGHYHPSVLKDKLMADQLAAAIRTQMGW